MDRAPAPATVSDLIRPTVFGSSTDQLVFIPIAPCRVVDTRPGPGGPGARTGILAANASRTFDLDTAAATSGQGGGPFPCPGLPAGGVEAWAVNITVVGSYTTQGGLKAWGFGSPEPNASVINWPAGQTGAIANGLAVIGCYGCLDDVTIKAFGDATHVIIDVMGYYRGAGVNFSQITESVGTIVSIAAGSQASVYGGNCPVGTLLIAGEVVLTAGLDVAVADSNASSATQWFVWGVNHDGVARDFQVFSRCMDTPIKSSGF